MTTLTIDPLAIAALIGFVILLLLGIGIAIWFTRKAMSKDTRIIDEDEQRFGPGV